MEFTYTEVDSRTVVWVMEEVTFESAVFSTPLWKSKKMGAPLGAYGIIDFFPASLR